jgi:hypothetical protein
MRIRHLRRLTLLTVVDRQSIAVNLESGVAMTSNAFSEALGEDKRRLPDRVHLGLMASDRVQNYLTLLQAAKEHAVELSEDELALPAASTIIHGLFAELAVMLHSLHVAADATPALRPALARYALRLARLHADAPSGVADRLPVEAIDALTRSGSDTGDCVWQLTVDLHAELKRVLTLIPTRSS